MTWFNSLYFKFSVCSRHAKGNILRGLAAMRISYAWPETRIHPGDVSIMHLQILKANPDCILAKDYRDLSR